MKIRIAILNYNGRELLEQSLQSIVEAARASPESCGVTVLDNQSRDGSELYVARNFKEVEFVRSASNRVFCSYNEYLSQVREEIVILLNNDITVERGFIEPLLEPFRRFSDAFFSCPRALHVRTRAYEGSLSKMEFRWGLLWGTARFPGFERIMNRENISMQCGFGAFHRERLLELGGFDDLYLPGTVEDADLCFRAYRRGWKGYYCPASVVYHVGQASFRRAFGEAGIRRINRRNLYLFVWKNIRNPFLLLEHVLFLPVHLLKYVLLGQWDFLLGFGDALRLLPRAIQRRMASRGDRSLVADRAIFELSRSIA